MPPTQAPLDTVEPSEHRQILASHERAECPDCQKAFMGAAIVTEIPELVSDLGASHYTGWAVFRRFYCDHCRQIVSWYEARNPGGVTRGERIGTHGLRRDPRAIAKFLTLHPEAAGVAQ